MISTASPAPLSRSLLCACAALSALVLTTRRADAAPVWVGDFETNDFSQWNNLLNGDHVTMATSPVIQGMYAAQVQLTNTDLWPNGLHRVELHHSPAAGRTDEGAELYFAWSFYLPDTLPTDPSQEIGYWESNSSYQQMMAFDVDGEHITFATRKPQNKVQWEADGMVTAATWHRIALHVKWSKDPAQGLVDVWFDGNQVVTQGGAQTLADDNDHFTQVGLLRGQADFQDSPIIYIDDAVEGDSLPDVHPELPTNAGGAGGAGVGGAGSGGEATGNGGASTGTGMSPSSAGAGAQGGGAVAAVGAGGAASNDDASGDSGCGCRTPRSAPASEGVVLGGLLALVALARRRRRG